MALGGDRTKAYVTLQEFFRSLGTDARAWGEPVSALLGAYTAQKELQIAAIGGKDSMSGTFEQLTVPPTLVSFAVTTENAKHIVSPEFKKAGHAVVLFDICRGEDAVLDWDVFRQHCDFIHKHMAAGDIYSARAVGKGGLAATLTEMAFGNGIGFTVSSDVSPEDLFALRYGAIVVETDAERELNGLSSSVPLPSWPGRLKSPRPLRETCVFPYRNCRLRGKNRCRVFFPYRANLQMEVPNYLFIRRTARNGENHSASLGSLFPFARERIVNTIRQMPLKRPGP